MKQEDIIGEWIADMCMKDGGALWHKDTKDEYPAPITFGDLRKLMEMENEVQESSRLDLQVSLASDPKEAMPEPNQQNGGWISVKDSLPDYIDDADFSKNVLTTDGKNIFIMARCYIEDAGGWLWGIANGIDDDAEVDDDYSFITHWQPIPKPPLK